MISNRRATIKQVAKVAGVSTQTVSRVINDRPDVASETRNRVRLVIDELGYQPSALARSTAILVTPGTMLVMRIVRLA